MTVPALAFSGIASDFPVPRAGWPAYETRAIGSLNVTGTAPPSGLVTHFEVTLANGAVTVSRASAVLPSSHAFQPGRRA